MEASIPQVIHPQITERGGATTQEGEMADWMDLPNHAIRKDAADRAF
jgi:hypothetical protein